MLEKDKLKQLCLDIIPERYKPLFGPVQKGDAPPHLTDVHYATEKVMQDIVATYLPESKNVAALCVNWGILRRDAGIKDWEPWASSFTIMLSSDPEINITSVLGLSFVILHEVGHVHWRACPGERRKWNIADEELFADIYAYERIEELYGMDVALKILSQYGSANGFKAFAQKDKECPM